jgi:hypothetical protein
MSVNPTAAGFTSRALPSEARTEKADLLTSEGLQGPKRADKAPLGAVLTSGGRRPERAESGLVPNPLSRHETPAHEEPAQGKGYEGARD